ncbi:DNA translocase FtsK [Lactobacillus sp. DCY120]|uniref:DNA translocase FtsK n=1 Tax=Bombilactobacillus apium TaxID=2675299 RepID=A0A850QYA3_9LACO|nr:DNA translocase FtsK [Bombilactobacillus apium]NVY96814.1 DNA translocase FtsK [Bombilactobacillus apium]
MATRQKMTKRKTRTTRKKTKKKQSQNYWVNFWGFFLLIWSAFAGFKLGLVGYFGANLYRFLVGNAFEFLAVVLGLVGLLMALGGQIPRLGAKRYLGLVLFFCGLVTIFEALLCQKLDLKTDIYGTTGRIIMNDLYNQQVITDSGGGLTGAILYSVQQPLFSTGGTCFLNSLLLLVGLLLFCRVEMGQIIPIFQNLARGILSLIQLVDWHKLRIPEFKPCKRSSAASKPKKNVRSTPATKQEITSQPQPSVDDFTIEGPPQASSPAPVAPSVLEPEPVLSPANPEEKDYQLPSVKLLDPIKQTDQSAEYDLIAQNRQKLQTTLASFGVEVEVKKATLGPTVTKYEVQPAVGVKVSRIVGLADDLALALAAKDIRIEAPIPGKPYVGIEVPNQHPSMVSFREVIEQEPPHLGQILTVPLGKDVYGQIAMCNLIQLPHLLIAGSTGSGKSVAINTIITGILMQARPSQVKLILIDPKMVELSMYNGIPHLLIPVVTDVRKATSALQKAVDEMERRYKLFEKTGHRKIEEYNQAVDLNNQDPTQAIQDKLPYIVIIVDELSDLMMAAGRDVETAIVRLTQKARAAGMHLVIATQRPSVDVITGLIKANVPSRMAFAVSSNIDSRTILDSNGAEKLLGRGDMLFIPLGESKPQRIQGAYISSEEVERVVTFVSEQQEVDYDQSMIPSANDSSTNSKQEPDDAYWQEAVQLVAREQKASVSMLQRRFKIGYNRAARLVDAMEEKGIVGPSRGAKPRKVLVERPEIEDVRTDE